ncbi:MAG TPA: hypothetical protein VI582_06925 [Aestuariivirga sp.]|nr:hypothetical protein [Aestuariivirga sp.]
MTDITMIEQMARAIAASRDSDDWTASLPAARAALVALREPTLDMLEAALPGLPDWGYLPEEWQAMIDHVMAEQPTVVARAQPEARAA